MRTHGLLALSMAAIASAHAETPVVSSPLPTSPELQRPFVQNLLGGPRYYRHSIPYLRIQTTYGPIYIQEDRFLSIIDISPPNETPSVQSPAPAVGSVVSGLPQGFSTFLHEGQTLFHADGAFYAYHGNSGFVVIDPPDGAIVRELPANARPVDANGNTVYEYRGIEYSPETQFGKTVYRIGSAP